MTKVAVFGLFAASATLVASESYAVDPTMADCLSASETSLKLRKDHHLREARQQLLVCAALTCPAEVRSECERRVVDVNGAIPTLVFEAKDGNGNDLSSVVVTMDGKPLVDRLEGTAISLDPGTHAFHFEAAGFPAIDKSFVLREGEKDRRERVVFGSGGGAAAASGKSGSTGSAGGSTTGADEGQSGHKWGTWQTVGAIVGGVGIVGLGVGTAFGVIASSDKSNAHCDSNGYCQSGPLNDAHTHANISTAGFIAGGVLAAAGVGLILFGPKGKSVQVGATGGAGSAGVVIGGAF